MKKILIFYLHCMVFVLISAVSVSASSDNIASFNENQLFPVPETPVSDEKNGFSSVSEISPPQSLPQPPVRTVVPAVNSIIPAAPSAATPEYRPFINVIPGIPDPYQGSIYRVQLGTFSNAGLARQCFNRLKSAGFTPYYEQYGSLYRVVITGTTAADMAGLINRLEIAGFSNAWIREER